MKLPARAYHLADAANWPCIRECGLRSTTVLLDEAGVSGVTRHRLEREQRREHTTLPNGVHIRDQRPMPPAALAKCLMGMIPAEWYALVNSWVFFWFDPRRLNRQRAACGPRPQVVLVVDAAKLVGAYADRVAMSPINTGNARRRPAKRGAATFVPYADWLQSGWDSEAAGLGVRARPRSHPPAELTVSGSIPDLHRFIVHVQELAPGQSFEPRVLDAAE